MKLLIIAQSKSELSELLYQSFTVCDSVSADDTTEIDFNQYDALAVLGEITLWPDTWEALEEQMKAGKRVFAVRCNRLGNVRMAEAVSTRFERPVLINGDGDITNGIKDGTIFDEQSNTRSKVAQCSEGAVPILQYVANPDGFYVTPDISAIAVSRESFALWLDTPELLCCSFEIGNFANAKFAPRTAWTKLLCGIIRWLGGSCPEKSVTGAFNKAYGLRGQSCDAMYTARLGSDWFENAGMILYRDNIPYAVKEGLSAHVRADGTHVVIEQARPDCAGEAALMYYLRHLATGDPKALKYARGIIRFPLSVQVKNGPHAGMVRWSPSSYLCTYQDDAARGFLLPLLWYTLLSDDKKYIPQLRLALDYLLKTTGTDGLRAIRTDVPNLDSDEIYASGLARNGDGKWVWSGPVCGKHTIEELASMPAASPSAHYNATYLASLLLFGLITGEKNYTEAGERGLTTIMEVYYPETAREHSETQELCRLILPMAILYLMSDDPIKKGWLYRIADDLDRFRHPSGGYIEWDTGHIASCAGVKGGESSVLAENGDPVSDMLYSSNWLPTGFAVAFAVTGDERFGKSRDYVAEYFAKVQILSDNPLINGAWPRSVDLDSFEVYGVPNDVGWAPWSVESGWTVAEIVSGLYFGKLTDMLGEKLNKERLQRSSI